VEADVHDLAPILSSVVLVEGVVFGVRDKNPFTKATKNVRNRMFLLKPVTIALKRFDHLWVFGFRSNASWRVGDVVQFTARLSTYEDGGGDVKFAAVAPYRNVRVLERGSD
jgi:hypothetical protein